jgi:hypothetical protein
MMRDSLLQQWWYLVLFGLSAVDAFTCTFTSSPPMTTRLVPTESRPRVQGISFNTIVYQTNNADDGKLDDFGLNEPFTEDRVVRSTPNNASNIVFLTTVVAFLLDANIERNR